LIQADFLIGPVMNRATVKQAGIGLMLLAAAGCGGGGASSPQATAPNSVSRLMTLSAQESTLSADLAHEPPRDAPAPVRELFRIDVYQFTAPLGSLGRNEDFWKRIDEQCVDVGTYDLLFKNGLRVGVAPMSEFDGIRKHIDADASCHSLSVTGTVAKQVQLETRKDLVEENIFHFDSSNEPIGRTYERCTNMINLSFEPTPRKPGSVRVKLCPMVRSARTQLEFTLLNDERELQWVNPEAIYDLNLRVDIPPDTFFILAPSSDADRLTSVGHAFLTQDSATERLEQVIVLVPRPLNADDPLTPPRPSKMSVNGSPVAANR
jgi:hypothetical protein